MGGLFDWTCELIKNIEYWIFLSFFLIRVDGWFLWFKLSKQEYNIYTDNGQEQNRRPFNQGTKRLRTEYAQTNAIEVRRNVRQHHRQSWRDGQTYRRHREVNQRDHERPRRWRRTQAGQMIVNSIILVYAVLWCGRQVYYIWMPYKSIEII